MNRSTICFVRTLDFLFVPYLQASKSQAKVAKIAKTDSFTLLEARPYTVGSNSSTFRARLGLGMLMSWMRGF